MPDLDFRFNLPLFEGLPVDAVKALASTVERHTFQAGDFVVRQHDDAQFAFVLQSGAVQFLLRFEGVDEFFVGRADAPGTLIGWSICRPPYRYTASVRCERPCVALRLSRRHIEEIIQQYPAFGYELLKRIAVVVADRIEDTRALLTQPPWLAQRTRDGRETS